jgi:hypothetical protein
MARMAETAFVPTVEQVCDNFFKRGLRFPTSLLHNTMLRFFDEEDFPKAKLALLQLGFKQVRSSEPDMLKYVNGEREVYFHTKVPDYYIGKIGFMVI